jgi:hypothetical protein
LEAVLHGQRGIPRRALLMGERGAFFMGGEKLWWKRLLMKEQVDRYQKQFLGAEQKL